MNLITKQSERRRYLSTKKKCSCCLRPIYTKKIFSYSYDTGVKNQRAYFYFCEECANYLHF